MTHFTMSNMDYTPVKFMIKIFEANYPESLGAVIVHKAPWIFQGIYKIIKAWLDPVVAAKVHFTSHVDDLETYIPRNQIIKELGGDEDWSYTYIEPIPGENAQMNDHAARQRLEAERVLDVTHFQNKTYDWIHATSGGAEAVKKDRDALADALNTNYWALDPYVRARSLYDRQAMIERGGKINFYPTAARADSKSSATATVVNGQAPPPPPPADAAASADDVD